MFLHGQGIHIAAQEDHLAVRVAVQHGHHAAAHQIRLISHLSEFFGDIGAGVGQIRAHLGVFVDVSAPAHQFTVQGTGLFQQFFHG